MFRVTSETAAFRDAPSRAITDSDTQKNSEYTEGISKAYSLVDVDRFAIAAAQQKANAAASTTVVDAPKHEQLVKNSTGSKLFAFLAKNKPVPSSRVQGTKPVPSDAPSAPKRKLTM